MVWDEDTIRILREFWAEGLSTAEIGRRLGVSKNAIVGKAHRLDLEARPSPIRRVPAELMAMSASMAVDQAGHTLPPLPSTLESRSVMTPGSQLRIVPPSTMSVPQRSADTMPPVARPESAERGDMADQVSDPALSNPQGLGPQGSRSLAPHFRAPDAPVRAAPSQSPRSAGLEAAVAATQPAARPVAPPRFAPLQPASLPPRRAGMACCWPIGEPGTKDFRFCDEASVAGKPYCEDHVRLAYIRVRDRKDDAA